GKVVEYLKSRAQPQYIEGMLDSADDLDDESVVFDEADAESDPLYDQAVEIVLKSRRASISLVQRHLRIGYNRAARLIEQMERAGLVSPMQTNGNRDVLAPAGKGSGAGGTRAKLRRKGTSAREARHGGVLGRGRARRCERGPRQRDRAAPG